MLTLQPSNARLWCNCTAAVQFSQMVPSRPPSDEQREGSCAAWLADLGGNSFDHVGETHSNGWMVDAEMARHIKGYLDLINSRGTAFTEFEVNISTYPPIWGRVDNAGFSKSGTTLYVDELKYGYRPVEVFENWQLIIYAKGLMPRCGPDVTHIQMGVYQPRGWHVDGIYRTWTIHRADLNPYIDRVLEYGLAAISPNPTATPGPHCAGCRAAVGCQALAQSAYSAAYLIASDRYRQMDNTELALELDFFDRAIDIITARHKAIKAEGEQRAKSEFIPGWQMSHRKGKRVFKYTGEFIKAVTMVDPHEDKLCTPAELERRGVPKAIVDTLTVQPNLPAKLTRKPKGTGLK